MKPFFDRWSHERIIAFAFVALTLVIMNGSRDIVYFPYDAGLYWDLSRPSFIGAFPDTYRGYLWPYLLMPVHAIEIWIGDASHWTYRIVSSMIYSLILTGPIAEFFERCFSGRLSIARRSWIAIAAIVIYPGLFLYPLSDLPAALFLICGILLADSRQSTRWHLSCVLSGAMIAAAYNARTIYIFAFAAMLILVPLFFFRGRTIAVRTAAILTFLLGAAIICIPQTLINKRVHGVASPLVMTGASGTSLMASQLYWGVGVQRYETSIRHGVPSASLYYIDPAGLDFNSEFPAYLSNKTISNYLKTVSLNPIFFLGVYGRHLINGIDVRDGMVYTSEPSKGRSVWSLLCFTLFALCAFILCARARRRYAEWGYLAPLLVTVACILPGAIETRFFIPVYLILFGVVATRFEWNDIRGQLQRHWITIMLGYTVLASVSMAVTTAAMAELQYAMP